MITSMILRAISSNIFWTLKLSHCNEKNVFKWQEGFGITMKKVFEEEYKADSEKAGLMKSSDGNCQYLFLMLLQ